MNPPSALQGAMSRDRKPFTYTPGGLDLSEIKSERMAARLMRNAMNQGVPEKPSQHIQSPPMPSTPVAVPNYNCLPVQVFPTFDLPANPKSLLRTRSNPCQPRDPPVQRAPPPPQSPFVNNSKPPGMVQYDTFNKNIPTYSQINNNRPASMYEYGAPVNNRPLMNYGSDGYSTAFPEISYDAEYFQMPPIINKHVENTIPAFENSQCENKVGNSMKPYESIDSFLKPDVMNNENTIPYFQNSRTENSFNRPEIEYMEDKVHSVETTKNENDIENKPYIENKETVIDISTKAAVDTVFVPETIISKPIEDLTGSNNEKKEVTVVKKQVVRTENNVEDQNRSEDQNGDTDVQAVMTVKLPTKKSAAKTETKVEVLKKILPDGSVEEVKKTITKTTIDGRTEIKTKTETTIIPKEEADEEVEEVEEEEEEESGEIAVQEVGKDVEPKVTEVQKSTVETATPEEDGQPNIIKTEERSESTTTTSKKVVIVQDDQEDQNEEEDVEEEEVEEVEPVVIKKSETSELPKHEEVDKNAQEKEIDEDIDDLKQEDVEEQEVLESKEKSLEQVKTSQLPEDEEEVEEEEEYEEAEEKETEEKVERVQEPVEEIKKDEDEEIIEKEIPSEKEEIDENPTDETKVPTEELTSPEVEDDKQKQEVVEAKQEVAIEKEELKEEKQDVKEETFIPKVEKSEQPEEKVPLREPSVPLEKVEDVEIKPIGAGDFVTRSHIENTEIITSTTEKPTGLLTEINRIENIVTVNRTTKTLDHSYENIAQQGIPTVKTYFTPHIEKILTPPQPARPYQPVYPPEPATERRHSLLLERLSVERQLPADVYQNNYQYSNQTTEQQRQWSQEPQAEILTVSNVKPSQITNQQWYQPRENSNYNNVTPTPQPSVAPSWTQTKPQTQPLYQPQPQYQAPPQPQYQPPLQTQYQTPPLPQAQTQYQPSYTEPRQESASNSYQNTYSSYTPKPSNWASSNRSLLSPLPTINTPSQPSQYSNLNTESKESYQKTTQHYSSSSYVPPPWEQDSTYVAPETQQNYYQPSPQTSTFSPAPSQGWKPPTSKFNKTPPTAYIPPKPNQSFVKPVINVEPPILPGRKTYYSEYERRYISVPESTYIPGDTKYQPQPDPSPKYYYDNNEPSETVEPQWRKELREFTEKTQTQTETNARPPWEMDSKYAKAPEATFTPTPTWSQTVRPQSWRERSFESEFVSQEWPKTNTLGRGRPLSSYGKETIPERTRGVSVDRYNPNSYQSPVAAEHPPVQTHMHVPPAPHATGYHNPNVPAYHARASAEPREQPISYQQPRAFREPRASPFQSRSFKYLQWITGTED